MKLLSGKRIGQSGYELVLAVFFSFFLHAAVVAAALLLYTVVTPKAYVPPFYEVKLVGQPAETAPLPQAAPTPPPMEAPKTEAPRKPAEKKAQPKAKKASHRAVKAAVKKGAIPELEQAKPKPESEEQKEEAAPAKAPAAQGENKAENVKVSAEPEDQTLLGTYSKTITTRINLNWNPPPGAMGLKAKVQFTINRSGMLIIAPELVESSGNFYFNQAAIRAIQQSSPFPAMPDDYYKQTATFTVDLVPID